jgi:hypothetical protein
MVYSSGSKMSRYQNSIINRPTCGGTAKKGGLAPMTTLSAAVNLKHVRARIQTTVRDQVCMPVRTIQTQQYGYHATRTGRM